jgi:hypothetical protein
MQPAWLAVNHWTRAATIATALRCNTCLQPVDTVAYTQALHKVFNVWGNKAPSTNNVWWGTVALPSTVQQVALLMGEELKVRGGARGREGMTGSHVPLCLFLSGCVWRVVCGAPWCAWWGPCLRVCTAFGAPYPSSSVPQRVEGLPAHPHGVYRPLSWDL